MMSFVRIVFERFIFWCLLIRKHRSGNLVRCIVCCEQVLLFQLRFVMASFDESCDLHPTVVKIELRLAWDGAWYPFDAQGEEKSFTGYYGESAEHFWELAKQRTRRAVISSISCGASEATIKLFHSSLELSQTRNALDSGIVRSLSLRWGILPPVVASCPANGCEYLFRSTQTPWGGTWHALFDQEEERSFAGYYIGSVEYLLELASVVSVLLETSTPPRRM